MWRSWYAIDTRQSTYALAPELARAVATLLHELPVLAVGHEVRVGLRPESTHQPLLPPAVADRLLLLSALATAIDRVTRD